MVGSHKYPEGPTAGKGEDEGRLGRNKGKKMERRGH